MPSDDDAPEDRPAPEDGPGPAGAAEVALELRAVADRSRSPLLLVLRSGIVRYANPAAGWVIGLPPESLEGMSLVPFLHPDDAPTFLREVRDVAEGRGSAQSVEYRVRSSDGTWKTLSGVASNLAQLPSASGVLISAMDVTEQHAEHETLRDLALGDPVTGLANRNRLAEHLHASVASAGPLSVAFLGIDRFRRINQSAGHTAGDVVLRAVGNRISGLLPGGSLVARFGGDTFVVVFTGVADERAVLSVWQLLDRIAEPLFVGGHELRLTVSAGIATRDGASSPESLLRDADAALTRAKASRRGGVVQFSEELRVQMADRLAIESDLRRAIGRDELRVFFQPVVRLADGAQVGSEALLRWARCGQGILTPGDFLPVAEEAGLMVPIGEWVMGAVIREMRLDPTLKASVNLSPRQLAVPGLAQQVERLLGIHGVDARQLAFEVTESVLVEDFEMATDALTRLRRLGCLVGLDDFGVGYSSLSYLRQLPVDFIKLDQSLVESIDTDPQGRTIVATIISLANALSLSTVAEGIERPAVAEALVAMGCDFGQGWLFGRPAPR